jgi:hypothetical protein
MKLIVFLLSISVAGGFSLPAGARPASPEFTSGYLGCVDQFAIEKLGEIYKNDPNAYVSLKQTDAVGAEAMAKCWPRFNQDVPNGRQLFVAQTIAQSVNNRFGQERIDRRTAEDARKRALDAPKLKKESEAAWATYVSCLKANVVIFALNSDEPAETISKATIESCRHQRQAIHAVHQKHNDRWVDNDTLDVADQALARKLLIDIIAVRAQRKNAPTQPPAERPAQTPKPSAI